jgi:OPA family glycerol-3-phosphate transporter-like MFS transporter
MTTVAAQSRNGLLRWQIATVALLFFGYAGYYFCRADLSVGLPLILEELRTRGVDPNTARIRMGEVVSLGVLAYALGKLTLAGLADIFGGKRNFLSGMAGAIGFTVLFAAGGSIPFFTLAWIGNRLIQSAGWAGLVKVSSRWFDFSSYGTVMGVLSISYLVGDAAARQAMGAMIAAGFDWRTLFLFAAAFLSVMLVLNLAFLRESRSVLGFSEPRVNPINLFGEAARPARGVSALLRPLVSSPRFWIVCALSLGTTLVRETFNTWTPTYFTSFIGLSAANSASWSAVFPAVGAVSVLLTGWFSDRVGARGRAAVMCAGLVVASLGLIAMAQLPGNGSAMWAVALTGIVAFGLIGPYSCLAGALAMDFGGAQGSAISSGLIDGVGYLGGVLAGDGVARISVAFGWQRALLILAFVCLVSALWAVALVRAQTVRRRERDSSALAY